MCERLALLLLLAAPSLARGQGSPGTNLTVDVRVTAVAMRGDTARIGYRLRSHGDSRESLFVFTVSAPAPVVTIWVRGTSADWSPDRIYRGRSVARWAAIDSLLPPGGEGPGLFFEAVGLPAIVTSWVQGYYPPQKDTLGDLGPASDPLVENSVPGLIVGIEPFPVDQSVGSLLSRLRALTDSTCHLAWIRDRDVCRELSEKLREAARDLAGGHATEAGEDLREFVTELGERSGREEGEGAHEERAGRDRVREPISGAAYWLLKVNAEYILARL